jgi:anthranilate synthase component I
MTVFPDFDSFAACYDAGAAQLVMTSLVADLETPVGAYLKLMQRQAHPAFSFLLESVEGGAVRGRYSIIGLKPDLIWRCENGKAFLNRSALKNDRFDEEALPPLDSLRSLITESRIESDLPLPPMAAGLFGYLGYDMVRLMECLPPVNPDALHVPDAILTRPTLLVIFDAVRDEMSLITPVRPKLGLSARAAFEAARICLEDAERALAAPLIVSSTSAPSVPEPVPVSNTLPDDYLGMVEQAKDYIRAGDIFQVVLSQRFSAPFSLPALALYRALRRVNPAPFLCYLDFAEFQIVCSSPEILVRARDGKVTIRPIAGTRPRGKTPQDDAALAKDLLADPKERAEHLMLLDLGRNDAGRVSKLGSVTVPDSFFLEYYSQVMHIVSQVEGEMREDVDALEALQAGFPAGTVSGAPKVRAMEIIDELEREKRGPYAGCIGYFGANGEMDTCIVLRTALVKDGIMHVQAGAGIVLDSDPLSEQQECVNKAKALFRAAEEAVRFAGQARRGQ